LRVLAGVDYNSDTSPYKVQQLIGIFSRPAFHRFVGPSDTDQGVNASGDSKTKRRVRGPCRSTLILIEVSAMPTFPRMTRLVSESPVALTLDRYRSVHTKAVESWPAENYL